VRFVPGNLDDLKPSAQIFIVAGQKMPDGTITAPAINVGRDGVAPPDVTYQRVRRIFRRNVRFGSKADISACPINVRFTPESGH
jgi:hypothetical protein